MHFANSGEGALGKLADGVELTLIATLSGISVRRAGPVEREGIDTIRTHASRSLLSCPAHLRRFKLLVYSREHLLVFLDLMQARSNSAILFALLVL
jgi:hypothetical protein